MKDKISKAFHFMISILMIFGAALFVRLPAGSSACGKDYYIDSFTGRDSNDGLSESTPWATTANIGSVSLNAGDRVLFRSGGTYECSMTLTCSGTKESPIVISTYGGSKKALLTTTRRSEVLRLFDCSYVCISDLELTAHRGGGIWIDTPDKASTGITLKDLEIHDIQNTQVMSRDDLSSGACTARACVMVKGLTAVSSYPVNDLTISDCEMYDCGNGISLWGYFKSSDGRSMTDPIFNTGTSISGCYFHDMDAEALIVGICDGAIVDNCRAIDCCQGNPVDEKGKTIYPCAAMWFWGSRKSLISHCEIAGQKNGADGMSIDFDVDTNYCTYEYIYSHDNNRFMYNCPYTPHTGNTVRFCLSVNDGTAANTAAWSAGEHDFLFYNNTIVNSGDIDMRNIYSALAANNIFMPRAGHKVIFDIDCLTRRNNITNNCYYNTALPLQDLSSLLLSPGFVSDDLSDPGFKLVCGSPLIGGGIAINDSPSKDIYGNEISGNNIGCYGSSGENGSYTGDKSLIGFFSLLWKRIIALLRRFAALFRIG